MLLPSITAARNYDHLFIAPHLDDAALSCGGQIAQLVDAGSRVLAVTLCAGDPPADMPLSPFAQYLHREWALGDDPIAVRRHEDQRALALLGCDALHLDQLDAPYRVAAYGVGDGWRGAVDPNDPLIAAAHAILAKLHEYQPAARVYVPLGVGTHVDHQVVCAAGCALHEHGADVRWYEDAPYAAKAPDAVPRRIRSLTFAVQPEVIAIDQTLERKLQAIGMYASQRRELFGDADWKEIMVAYAAATGAGGFGERLWRAA